MERLISNYVNPRPFAFLEDVEYGKGDSIPLDQTSVQKFNIDPATGMPISDISAIIRANNLATQRDLVSRLQEFKADFLPADISDADAIKYAVPRYAQLPSEVAEMTEMIAQKKLDDLKAQKERESAEAKAKADEEYQKMLDEIVADFKSSKSKSE